MSKTLTKPTGGSSSYYVVRVEQPTSLGAPYDAECNDIIEALGMNFAEGNAFKALWRAAASRSLAIQKSNYEGALYDAEKVVFFGQRLVSQLTVPAAKPAVAPLEFPHVMSKTMARYADGGQQYLTVTEEMLFHDALTRCSAAFTLNERTIVAYSTDAGVSWTKLS